MATDLRLQQPSPFCHSGQATCLRQVKRGMNWETSGPLDTRVPYPLATALFLQPPSPFCHSERTRISYFTALTGAAYVVLLKENHMQLFEATTLDRKSGEAEESAVRLDPSPIPKGNPTANPQKSGNTAPFSTPFRPKGGIRALRALKAHTFPVAGPGKKAGGSHFRGAQRGRTGAIPLQSVASSTGETPPSSAARRTPYPSLTACGP